MSESPPRETALRIASSKSPEAAWGHGGPGLCDALVGGSFSAPDDGACADGGGGCLDSGVFCFLAFSHHFTEFCFEFSSSDIVHLILLYVESIGCLRLGTRGSRFGRPQGAGGSPMHGFRAGGPSAVQKDSARKNGTVTGAVSLAAGRRNSDYVIRGLFLMIFASVISIQVRQEAEFEVSGHLRNDPAVERNRYIRSFTWATVNPTGDRCQTK